MHSFVAEHGPVWQVPFAPQIEVSSQSAG